MLRLTAFISFFVFTILSLIASPKTLNPGLILIGGSYTIQPGETRQGDMVVLFARVEIAAGGKIEGRLNALGSKVVIDGTVTDMVQSIASDLIVQPTAQIAGGIDQILGISLPIQLPSFVLVIS
jgi:hypothetical protein